jgi:hypothetical protein
MPAQPGAHLMNAFRIGATDGDLVACDMAKALNADCHKGVRNG